MESPDNLIQGGYGPLGRYCSLEKESDPIETFVEVNSRLKELGFVEGGAKTENVEAKRLQIDLEKWKHENNSKLQRSCVYFANHHRPVYIKHRCPFNSSGEKNGAVLLDWYE